MLLIAAACLIGGRLWLPVAWHAYLTLGILLLVLMIHVGLSFASGMVGLAVSLLAVFYIAWTFSFLLDVRSGENGFISIIILFLIVWVYDTGAYLFGIRFGIHKMAPQLSPKKSWEGLIGGLFSALAVLLVLNSSLLHYLSPISLAGVTLVTAGAAQVGDLLESYFKRLAGVKDSGSFLPGHGGFLDRFDSFLCAAPIYYFCLVLLGGGS